MVRFGNFRFVAIVSCIILSLSAISCVRDEAPNAEADILTCIVEGDILKAEPEIDNESVTLTVKSDADITNLAPRFTLTPGATISPASGTPFDFSVPRQYKVTSEDRNWTKTYTVRCVVSGVSTDYHFEKVAMEPKYGRYEIFYDFTDNGDSIAWASGNGGYSLTGVPKKPSDYPTLSDDNGYVGRCAKLVTRSTGEFGSGFGMPMAAGNLFIGSFDILNAIPDARKGTRFGRTYEHVPTYITGYYKYKAGDRYMANGEEIKGKRDKFDIYALFFECDDEVTYLDGFNRFDSPNLVSVARITDQKESDEWIYFNIPFVAKPGKVVDKQKLADGGYKLSIVFSSSINGDTFEGAEGSTLWIDEVEIIQSDNNR